MTYVVVYTDKGQQIWQSKAFTAMIDRLHCPGNTSGAEFARGIRQAVYEAECIEQNVPPHEVREIPGWNVASYTKKHMSNLNYRGRTVELFRQGDKKDEGRARSRIMNAARRLNIKVETYTDGSRMIGTVKKEQTP